MHVDLFTHGISILRRVEAQRQPFHIGSWVANVNWPTDCRTTACAVGWMCRDAVMNKAGLRFWRGVPSICDAGGNWVIESRGLAQFFGISTDESLHLFMPCHYDSKFATTAAMVADRMQQMLDAHLQAQPVDKSEPVVVKGWELELA